MNQERVSKGLVIDSHWVSLILAGRKTWEMRSRSTDYRGLFGLIRKGSGKVCGVARLVDCLSPLSREQMIENVEMHQIPEGMIRDGEVDRWTTPWLLSDVIPLPTDVPYEHPNGAVIWVNLDDGTSEEISRQLSRAADFAVTDENDDSESDTNDVRGMLDQRELAASVQRKRVFTEPSVHFAEGAAVLGRSVVTSGNLKNHHIYLRDFIDRFPGDAVGGSSKMQAIGRKLSVQWNGSGIHETDIDGEKKFFRSRSLVRKFFQDTSAEEGDVVIIVATGPYAYRLELERGSYRPKTD